MSRPAKAIDTNSQKMSKEERKQREETEKKLRGDNDKIKPFKYLNKRQKAIFKDILKNLNKDILSNLDVYLLNQTAITIERLESIEKEINNASKVIDENGKEIIPTEPNSYKFESFIFDAFEFFDDIAILRGKREDDFAPVKNKDGVDSPKTAKELYEKYWNKIKK